MRFCGAGAGLDLPSAKVAVVGTVLVSAEISAGRVILCSCRDSSQTGAKTLLLPPSTHPLTQEHHKQVFTHVSILKKCISDLKYADGSCNSILYSNTSRTKTTSTLGTVFEETRSSCEEDYAGRKEPHSVCPFVAFEAISNAFLAPLLLRPTRSSDLHMATPESDFLVCFVIASRIQYIYVLL